MALWNHDGENKNKKEPTQASVHVLAAWDE
jgi:hypothetical protein